MNKRSVVLFPLYILTLIIVSDNNFMLLWHLEFLLYILMCHSQKKPWSLKPTHSTKSLVWGIKTFRKIMSSTEEAKALPVSECSSEMIMTGLKNVILFSINEDAGVRTVRNGNTPFLIFLLIYILNQTSWHFVYLSVAGFSFNVS